jgi:hypothetical protein
MIYINFNVVIKYFSSGYLSMYKNMLICKYFILLYNNLQKHTYEKI